jgi:hypothetical protein
MYVENASGAAPPPRCQPHISSKHLGMGEERTSNHSDHHVTTAERFSSTLSGTRKIEYESGARELTHRAYP